MGRSPYREIHSHLGGKTPQMPLYQALMVRSSFIQSNKPLKWDEVCLLTTSVFLQLELQRPYKYANKISYATRGVHSLHPPGGQDPGVMALIFRVSDS